VAADLRVGCTALFGIDPNESVLDGVLASTAIPPWVRPLDQGSRLVMDGGVVSNLPIEPALSQGATEIVALHLADPRPVLRDLRGFGSFLNQLIYTVEQRQLCLEKQLATAQGFQVYHVPLQPVMPLAVWQFDQAVPLLERGYALMQEYLQTHPQLIAYTQH